MRKHPFQLSATTVYLAGVAGMGFFTTLVFTLNLVYHVKTVGLDPLQLVLVGTALELTIFLFEIPTGVVADVFSRKFSTVIGFLVMGIGFVIEGSLPFFGGILLAQVVWGLGYTFISGAFDAWITDEVGSAAVGKVFMRANQARMIAGVVGIPISALLGNVLINLPILVGGVLLVLMAGWLWLVMPETAFSATPKEEREGMGVMLETLREGLRLLKKNRPVLQYMGAMLFVGLASEAYDRLGTAHLLENFAFPRAGQLNLSDETWFGALALAATLLTLFITEFVVHKIDLRRHRSVTAMLVAASVCVAVGMALFAGAGTIGVAIAAFLLINISRGMLPPIESAWVNQHVPSHVRATTLSMSEQVNSLGQVAGGPLLGLVGRNLSIRLALWLSSILHAVPVYFYSRSFRDSVNVAGRDRTWDNEARR